MNNFGDVLSVLSVLVHNPAFVTELRRLRPLRDTCAAARSVIPEEFVCTEDACLRAAQRGDLSLLK